MTTYTRESDGRTFHSEIRLPFAVHLNGPGYWRSFGSLDTARRAARADGRAWRVFFDYAPGCGVLIDRG